MMLSDYRENRRKAQEAETKFRSHCFRCFQPSFGCYCAQVRRFDPNVEFVILIHPLEARRRIATGRMTHLCLENSHLLQGECFDGHAKVEALLNDANLEPMILYPGPTSTDLSSLADEGKRRLVPTGKKLCLFVIDGTWATARKMVRSENLRALPRLSFATADPSRFRVRKQPRRECLSTIEAVHRTIDLLGSVTGFENAARQHDVLLRVFDSMVEKQLECLRSKRSDRQAVYRRERKAHAD